MPSPLTVLSAVLLGIQLPGVAAGALQAPTYRTVTGSACDECSIVREVVLTIPGRREEMVSPYTILARDSRGRWLLSTVEAAPRISVYDSTGSLLQSFGRQGAGPGEHRTVTVIAVTAGDTVHVFDNALRRHSVYSPSYQYVRSTLYVGRVWEAIEVREGTLALNADIPTPDRVGYPLHLMHPDGTLGQSFGSASGAYRVDASLLLNRYITHAGGTEIWDIPWLAYQASRWGSSGATLHLQRDVPWFRTVTDIRPPGQQRPPSPWVMGIWMDQARQLWVMLRVPDENWRPQAGAVARRSDGPGVIAFDREYDTIIEILDPATGRVIATERFDQALWRLMPGGLVSWYREEEDGEPHLEVWQLTLTRPTRRGP